VADAKRKTAAARKRKTPSGRKRKTAPAASRKRKTAPAKATRRRDPPTAANGYRLVSVFGPFNAYALVEMSAERAAELFDCPLTSSLSSSVVIDATEAELKLIAKRNPGLAGSALAASAVALAYEIQNPYNSATSKSMCARELRETMAKLRELAPEADAEDGIDELGNRREARRRRAAS
jgi:hypothetical protein